MEFKELNLKPELITALNKIGLTKPTEVQEKAIPLALSGKDVIVRSKTGSGKTFAFLLPILQRLTDENVLQALVLAPTRELAVQIGLEAKKLSRVNYILLYGGVAIGPQIEKLEKGVQLVIATPGRVLDLMQRGTLNLGNVRFAVLDEADRMLDMGFIDDVEKILRTTPKERQTMMFSATMPEKIERLASRYMNAPEMLMLQQDEITVKQIRQQVIGMDRKQKLDYLLRIMQDKSVKKMMIFCNTKDWAQKLSDILYRKRYQAASIHSALSQAKRNKVIQDFNAGRYEVLVATDVAARGLHIEGVTHVVNYDIPRNPKDYVHRIGRTGRAGKDGDAITFVTQPDEPLLRAVESEIQMYLDVQQLQPDGKLGPKPERIEHAVPPHAPHPGHPVETITVHTTGDKSGDDWGLD